VGLNNIDNQNCFPFLDDDYGQRIDVDRHTDLISIWKAMELHVDAGLAKSIGLANFNTKQIKLIIKNARIQPANLQVSKFGY